MHLLHRATAQTPNRNWEENNLHAVDENATLAAQKPQHSPRSVIKIEPSVPPEMFETRSQDK